MRNEIIVGVAMLTAVGAAAVGFLIRKRTKRKQADCESPLWVRAWVDLIKKQKSAAHAITAATA